MNKYDYIILIGRMQLFHLGHNDLLNRALKAAYKKVIIVLGSSYTSKNIKNPFSAVEREEMITDSLSDKDKLRVAFVHQRDHYYNHNRWLSEVQKAVDIHSHESSSVALIGHEHDHTSFYLKDFPQWSLIRMPESDASPHATELREILFSAEWHDARKKLARFLPSGTLDYLDKWSQSEMYEKLRDEHHFVKKYKELWESAPFPVQFTTVDAVVIKSGHVLVVKRGGNPGKGLWALPGGFLNEHELIVDGAVRELKEETRIKVSKKELKSAITCNKVFDHPGRSTRGRTITHAFLMNLGNGSLPEIKGSDDAVHAKWLPLNEVDATENMFFEDHWHIITYFYGLLQ